MTIKVLGSGCANCQTLERLCREVVAENKIDATVEKVTDLKEIMGYGILSTPGLVVDGKVVSSGKLPTKSMLTHWLVDGMAIQS